MAGYLQTLIGEMPWSWTRLTSYDDCRYGWYLKYILGYEPDKRQFFSGYGSLIHEILELWLSGKADRETLVSYYLNRFRDATEGDTPRTDMRLRYFEDGLDYVKNLEPFPFETVAAEKHFRANLNGAHLVGIIDLVGRDADGSLVIVDHKSRRLRPRSKRRVPTESDRELDSYLRQLYLYALPVFAEERVFPKYLAFNCFRDRRLIKEEFDERKFEQTMNWATDKIREITENEDFSPNIDYFKCKYLCEMRNECEYYKANFGKE